ncbi:metalloprotease [Chryseobacterium sp. PMSZPI]|uniref:metalloprotease n=1 Tax=Chryseobacterium sp. PMSZPI TaxID=1033900 RepID=UPI000C32F77A|nr:metalloprotease [Chryseobacterium sp. PMSZPI]PKF72877.1 metalloprotease [Chryseobacterium sp. PMSZPI]
MKKILTPCFLAGAIAVFSLTACQNDKMEESTPNETLTANAKPEQPNLLEKACSFVDFNWSWTAVLRTSLPDSDDTNFMNTQMANIASMWGKSTPTLRFVEDLIQANKTYNAMSYQNGYKIYYGYDIFKDAKAKGGNIVNAFILGHEFGHQLQYMYNLPTVKESTGRPNDLEADGFGGYYLRRPNGYNKTTFSEVAAAYEFAQSIGDYDTTNQNHHGTPAQRRSAVRLGFLIGQYDVSPKDFDTTFFAYYNGVLDGSYKMADNKIKPEIKAYLDQYVDELKKIKSGEITAEQFKQLQ